MSKPARFLSRWSRLKRQAVVETPSGPAMHLDADALATEAGAQADSGTSLAALLREELSEAVRKQTLKAIFADPHFNVMDGLDTYIDDYSISEPIPQEMLATLNQARFLFQTAESEPPIEEKVPEEQMGAGCDNLGHAGQKIPTATLPEPQQKEK